MTHVTSPQIWMVGDLPWHESGFTTSDAMTIRWRDIWRRNSSIALMILAQLISSFMAVAAKLLQTAGHERGALDTRQVCNRKNGFLVMD